MRIHEILKIMLQLFLLLSYGRAYGACTEYAVNEQGNTQLPLERISYLQSEKPLASGDILVKLRNGQFREENLAEYNRKNLASAWLYFCVKPKGNGEFGIFFDSIFASEIQFYAVKGEKILEKTAFGEEFELKSSQKKVFGYYFPINSQAGKTFEFFIQIKNPLSYKINASYMPQQKIQEHETRFVLSHFFYFGLVVGLFLYNLLLYLLTRDQVTLCYLTLLAFTHIFFIIVTSGFGAFYIYTDKQFLTINLIPYSMFGALLAGMWFCEKYLMIRENFKRVFISLRVVAVIAVLPLLIPILPLKFQIRIESLLICCLILTVLAVSILRMKQGFKPAVLLFVGWTVAIAFVLMRTFVVFTNFLDLNYFDLKIGFTLEALIFSLSIGYRYNLMKAEVVEHEKTNRELKHNLEKEALLEKIQIVSNISDKLNSPLMVAGNIVEKLLAKQKKADIAEKNTVFLSSGELLMLQKSVDTMKQVSKDLETQRENKLGIEATSVLMKEP